MHAWLGIHILSRGVIFVDLALAQIAALGAMTGILFGIEPGTTLSYVFALGFTLVGALVFSLTRFEKSKIPQEAIIGIVYAVAGALGIVVTAGTPDIHAVEKVRHILMGRSIVWVSGAVVLKTSLVYGGVALVHYLFRKPFLLVSTRPEEARERGMNLRFWDFLFYTTFGVVITSSVQIAGVLLVFCFLIVPAVFGAMWAEKISTRLFLGWGLGTLASMIGLLLSYELPSGPVIVVVFGGLLLSSGMVKLLLSGRRKAQITGGAGLIVGLSLLVLLFASRFHAAAESEENTGSRTGTAGEGVQGTPSHKAVPHEDLSLRHMERELLSSDSSRREKALEVLRAHPNPKLLPALHKALQREDDPDLRIHIAEEGMRMRDRAFVGEVVQLIGKTEMPFFREEAIHLLKRFVELPPELTRAEDLDASRLASWWKKAGKQLVWDPKKHRFASPGN
ncbi:MAG TPA: hypothetical protein ENK02_13690 [Planctomycetes bacterium]|nr:hypothetical protein [Planctomycetota bacterium]